MSARLLAVLALALFAAAGARLDDTVRRIDSMADDAEGRLAVSTAMAERLGMHRNRIALLRRETGKGYGEIFVSTLRSRGVAEAEIQREADALLRELNSGASGGDESGPGPVLTLSTGVDHSTAATFYSMVPEAGIESRHALLTVGAPLYRVAAGGTVSQGVGDVFAAGTLRGQAAGLDASATLSVGFPTGDSALGLGAGKTTVDGTFTLGRTFTRGRIFGSAGASNFVFNNFIYQRPYIADGSAGHFSGGGEFYPDRRVAIGIGGFAVQPSGTQTVSTPPSPDPWQPGRGRGHGTGKPEPPAMPAAPAAQSPVVSNQTQAAASDLADRGVNGWATIALSKRAWLQFGIARSIPFSLTTARVGLVFSVFGRTR